MKCNKKSLILSIFNLTMITFLSSCQGNTNSGDKFYDSLYKENLPASPYSLSEDYKENKASFGYYLNTKQGFNSWYYHEKQANNYVELFYDSSIKGWKSNKGTIIDDIVSGENIARTYVSDKSGDVVIKGNFASISEQASLVIYKNNEQIYPSSGSFDVFHNDEGYYYETNTSVEIGDSIHFVVNGEAKLNPIISFDNEEVLYQVPEWGFYGDVHPFYYQGKMYMYNLRGYLENPGNENYMWCLHESSDLFHYEEADYEVFSFVQNHYNASIDVYNSIFDEETFSWGSRDMFLFYDHIAKKYVYFGLCYYRDRSSCFGTRVSDDKNGTVWSKPMFSIRDFPRNNDPECSQAMFINDRWYIMTSIWGESIHSVGKPMYLIGDKGKAFLDTDWSKKEPHYLDGEDLCAYQVVDVGGKYQMYGWIPKTSYTNKEEIYFDGSRDHGLWGGNINMPREVYQNKDGTLSTRLDPKAKSLLNRGIIYENPSLSSNDSIQGTYGRSYVDFDVKLNGSSSFAYTMNSNGKDYSICLDHTNDGTYLSFVCKQDKNHPVASQVKVSNSAKDNYHFNILIDRSIVEVYVDDSTSLTARTSIFNVNYSPSFISDKTSEIKNLTINKLAYLSDIYD